MVQVDGPPVAGFIAIPHQECYAEVLEYFTKFSTVDTVQICGIQCLAMADCYSFTYVPSVKSCQHHSIYCYAKDLMKNCQQNYYQKESELQLMTELLIYCVFLLFRFA